MWERINLTLYYSNLNNSNTYEKNYMANRGILSK